MIESGFYPLGTEYNPDAPWNQCDNTEKEIEVTVNITLSKNVKIKVTDYNVCVDEDGHYIDYSDCDLKSAVENQILLPQDAGNVLEKCQCPNNIVNSFKDWVVDDFEVVY